jgi:asparagine synthase (glutamine-hydrolysing)
MADSATALLPAGSRIRTSLRGYGPDLRGLISDSLVTLLPHATLREVARGPLREAVEARSPRDVVRPLLERAPPEEVGAVNSMRYLDFAFTLAGDILVKVDRAAMAVSLETRPVYLHPSLLELAGRIPPERLAQPSEAKRLLKKSLRPWLSDELLYRPKSGFALPLGDWLRDGRAPLADRGPGPDPLDELLDPRFVAEATRAHQGGRSDATALLHAVGFLRGWLQRWL